MGRRKKKFNTLEKAFGNFQKIGSRKFIDVLTPAEEPFLAIHLSLHGLI